MVMTIFNAASCSSSKMIMVPMIKNATRKAIGRNTSKNNCFVCRVSMMSNSTSTKSIASPAASNVMGYSSLSPSSSTSFPQHQQSPYKNDAVQRLRGGKATENETKRLYHRSATVNNYSMPLSIVIKTSYSKGTNVDQYLGNLLDGFCNGSCNNNITTR